MASANAEVIDFDTDEPDGAGTPLAAGFVIGPTAAGPQPYADDGIILTVVPTPPGTGPLMLFDSGNPTGGDTDIGSPNEDCPGGGPGVGSGGAPAGPGPNCDPLGNILIISEDGDSSDPDDSGPGGQLTILFDEEILFQQITFLDDVLGEVRFFDADDNLLLTEPINDLNENELFMIVTAQPNVRRVVVDVDSSMGLPSFTFLRQRGSVTVVKQTIPDGATQSFEFTGDAAGMIQDGGSITTSDLPAGTYSATELVPAGWQLTDISCDDNDSSGDLDNATATFQLQPDEDITCTFTNTQNGTITVVKQTNPDGSQQSFNFSGSLGNFSLSDGQSNSQSLAPGNYSVSELVPPGWELSSASCDDGSTPDAIDLAAGENITCTFVNTQNGSIVIEKQTLPDGANQSFAFTGDLGAFNLSDGEQNTQPVIPGVYSVSETVPGGWVLSDTTCDDGSPVNAIDVSAGETVTCVFTNTQNGSLTVIKQTDPAGSPQSFNFTGSLGNFSLSDGQSTSGALPPGTYSVSEDVPTGWVLASASCDDQSPVDAINIGPGENVTCTFINTQNSGITIVKQTIGGDDSFDFTSQTLGPFTLTTVNNTMFQTFADLEAGSYDAAETVPQGWQLTSASCDDDDSSPDNIQLAAGESVTCTFVNTQDGTITVVKETNPPGAADSFDFTGDLGNFSLSHGESNSETFQPGIYSVSETVPAGWELTSATCDDGSDPSAIDLAGGESVTCTFLNTQDGSITIVKNSVGNDAAFDFLSTAFGNFTLDTVDNTADITFSSLSAGNYDVAEDVPDGWQLTSASCDDGSDPANIQLSEGESVICTFVNTQDEEETGMITVVKNTISGNGEFQFTSSTLSDFTLVTSSNTASQDFLNLAAGTYDVSEINQADWDLQSASCDDGSSVDAIEMEPGESITCTFVNSFIFIDDPEDPPSPPRTVPSLSSYALGLLILLMLSLGMRRNLRIENRR